MQIYSSSSSTSSSTSDIDFIAQNGHCHNNNNNFSLRWLSLSGWDAVYNKVMCQTPPQCPWRTQSNRSQRYDRRWINTFQSRFINTVALHSPQLVSSKYAEDDPLVSVISVTAQSSRMQMRSVSTTATDFCLQLLLLLWEYRMNSSWYWWLLSLD